MISQNMELKSLAISQLIKTCPKLYAELFQGVYPELHDINSVELFDFG